MKFSILGKTFVITDENIAKWKTASWTFWALVITIAISALLTGSLLKGGLIGTVCRLAKIPVYYYHEIYWDRAAKQTAQQSA